jgi:MYXO-CTERM domain-containing protein
MSIQRRNHRLAVGGTWLRALAVATLTSAVGVGACAEGTLPAGGSGGTADGALKGQLVQAIARFDDGRSETTYYLRVSGNERDERELHFPSAPDVPAMTEIKVWGVEEAGRILVDRFELVTPTDGIETRREALINAPPIAATNMAMVMVDVGGGVNITAEELNARLFTNVDSIKAYYLENSFGMHDLKGMVMPKTYTYPLTACANTDTRAMTAALKPMVEADAGQKFDIYLWYIGMRTSLCSWSGLSSGVDTFYNGSSSCVVLVQEPGHSFGFAHSSSMACKDASGATSSFADDVQAGCTHSEYGNRYDTMGGGCRHFSAYHKTYRTYLQKCNGVKVRSSGTYTLLPIENACNGIQVLQVPMQKTRPFMSSGGGGSARTTNLAYYLVELRTPTGFDAGRTPMVPTVLINAAPDFSVYDAANRRGRGEHIWLLDMAPATTSGTTGPAHGLAAGQTFMDPAGGISITTEAVSATSATIRVTMETSMGDSTCLDGTPIAAPGPATCGAVPGGTGGATGAGGAAGASGGTGGAAGTIGTGGGAGPMMPTPDGGARPATPDPSRDVTGGCGCSMPTPGGSLSGGMALLVLALSAWVGRRRRK